MNTSRNRRPTPTPPAAAARGVTYRLDVEYDGTGYRGWQIQPGVRSVEGELSRAIRQAGGRLLELGGSGRTDAGVHALGQVAHLRLEGALDPERLRREVNDALPAAIHVTGLVRARPGFHARHDARRRSYLYQISRRRSAFAKRFVWWVRDPLDAAAMANAAQALVGRHDFRRYCEQPAAQTSTIVVVDDVRVIEAGELLLVRVSASHFLWKMVRRLVGTLAQVGAGRLPLAVPGRLLAEPDATDVSPAEFTAPPSGLFLERVEYPGETPAAEPVPAFPVAGATPAAGRYTGRPERRNVGRRGRR